MSFQMEVHTRSGIMVSIAKRYGPFGTRAHAPLVEFIVSNMDKQRFSDLLHHIIADLPKGAIKQLSENAIKDFPQDLLGKVTADILKLCKNENEWMVPKGVKMQKEKDGTYRCKFEVPAFANVHTFCEDFLHDVKGGKGLKYIMEHLEEFFEQDRKATRKTAKPPAGQRAKGGVGMVME